MDNNTETVDFQIVIKFSDYSKLAEYMSDLEAWEAYKTKRSERKLDDKRGKHTKLYHEKARHYKLMNPKLSYRECMSLIKQE